MALESFLVSHRPTQSRILKTVCSLLHPAGLKHLFIPIKTWEREARRTECLEILKVDASRHLHFLVALQIMNTVVGIATANITIQSGVRYEKLFLLLSLLEPESFVASSKENESVTLTLKADDKDALSVITKLIQLYYLL